MSVYFKFFACRDVVTVIIGLLFTSRLGTVTRATSIATNAGGCYGAVKAIRRSAYRGSVMAAAAAATVAVRVTVHCAAGTKVEKCNKQLHNSC